MPQIEDILIALNRSMVDDGKLLHRRYNRIMLVHWLKRALLCCTSFFGKAYVDWSLGFQYFFISDAY